MHHRQERGLDQGLRVRTLGGYARGAWRPGSAPRPPRKGVVMGTDPDVTRRPPARVLIADDHALLRSGIRAMLAGEPDIEVVGEAADGREAVALCRELRPDLVLMDVGMPGVDGMEATRRIKAENPAVGVLVVTAHPSPDYVLDAVRAGAAGYI